MWKYVAFLVLILCSFGAGADVDLEIVEPTNSTVTNSTEESTTPIETTITPEDTTTISNETTTGIPITTTKIITTEAPKTSHATVAPTETPKPELGKWKITDSSNVTCIRAEMALQFQIHTVTPSITINLSPNASTKGSDCHPDNDTQLLVLSEGDMYSLALTFAKDTKESYVRNISFTFKSLEGDDEVTTSGKFFAVNKDKSYKCNAQQSMDVQNVTLSLSSVRLQAFGEKGKSDYALPQECSADDNLSDTVPIAVGCALAALVVIVLIAYLVGRRQSRQKGYQSV